MSGEAGGPVDCASGRRTLVRHSDRGLPDHSPLDFENNLDSLTNQTIRNPAHAFEQRSESTSLRHGLLEEDPSAAARCLESTHRQSKRTTK